MKITLLTIGKTENNYLVDGIKIFKERLVHYIKFEIMEIETPKQIRKLSPDALKEAEGRLILKAIQGMDHIVLLDEKGKTFTSEQFADWLQKLMNAGTRHLVFIVGGAYGFSDEVYQAANSKVALSALTFSHQMVRLFFTEQLYRAFTILKNEPYHNA
jgi:23S rRNA (pseudouridine1915-N3)-methyltransferase